MAIKKIVWLGHASFLLYLENSVVAIDPWFNGNPAFPKKFELPKIDYVLLTHGHQDHSGDAGRILSSNKEAKVVAQFELALLLQNFYKLSSNQIISTNVGGHIQLDDVSVKIVNAIHSSSVIANNEVISTGSPIGFVIKDNKNTIYYAGDTSLMMDMKIIGETNDISLAILPVGGTYTMDYTEVPYAMRLLNANRVIPMHYNTFPAISINMDNLKKLCVKNDIILNVLKVGEEFCDL